MQDNINGVTELQAEAMLLTMRYRRLHQEAYGYPARQTQVDTALERLQYTLTDATLDMEEMLDESHGLAEVCNDDGIPKWMIAGAPNPETFRRWLTTGQI